MSFFDGLDHWMKIADWGNKILIKAQENNEKIKSVEIIDNWWYQENLEKVEELEKITNPETKLSIVQKTDIEQKNEKIKIVKNINIRENFDKVEKLKK